MTTVIGPVGSEISVDVPPNNDANKPIIIAPYRPASAPAPEATPKVKASGNETIAAVKPPNASPLRLSKVNLLRDNILFKLFFFVNVFIVSSQAKNIKPDHFRVNDAIIRYYLSCFTTTPSLITT